MTTHNIPFSLYKKKITRNYSKSAAMGFFPRAQERVRNSRGKRAISVRVTECHLFSSLNLGPQDYGCYLFFFTFLYSYCIYLLIQQCFGLLKHCQKSRAVF